MAVQSFSLSPEIFLLQSTPRVWAAVARRSTNGDSVSMVRSVLIIRCPTRGCVKPIVPMRGPSPHGRATLTESPLMARIVSQQERLAPPGTSLRLTMRRLAGRISRHYTHGWCVEPGGGTRRPRSGDPVAEVTAGGSGLLKRPNHRPRLPPTIGPRPWPRGSGETARNAQNPLKTRLSAFSPCVLFALHRWVG